MLRKITIACWTASVIGGLCAFGQAVPKLNSVSQDWLQRGSTGEITFAGENLTSATNLIFSGDSGLTATIIPPEKPSVQVETSQGGISTTESTSDKKLTARIKVSADATLRPREVRVVSATGVSNPLTLNVGYLPEISQKEPNNTTNQAQVIELPVAVTGTIKEATKTDYYRFSATKGQRLIFDVYGYRIGSPLDSSLAVLDALGKELARNEDANGLDSLIVWTVSEDGEYYVQLRDFRYQGGADFKYRLYAGVMPYVEAVYPFGGRRGENVPVELKGQNLGGSTKLTLHLDSSAPVGQQQIQANTPLGFSNPFLFEVSDLPNIFETEPNNTTNQANLVTVPVAINGRLSGEKDVDIFKFKVNQDQRLICEVTARRFGSGLDALLTLSDATGKVLQQNDDAEGADSRIDFDQFKKDGEYFLTIKDLQDRSGDNFTYRLSIRQPVPDFAVKVLPDTPRVRRGGRSVLRCELARLTGFNDMVRVVITDLPPGVFAEPLLLSASGPPSGLIVVSAAKEATEGTFPVKLVASSVIGGKMVTRTVVPLSNDRPVKQAFLTVLDEPPFTIEPSTLSVVLEQDQSATLELLVPRRPGFMGEIKLSAEGFSAGREPVSRSLEMPDVTLKGSDVQAKIKVKARLDAETGTRNVVFKGETTVDGQTVTEFSNTLPVTITQIPFAISPSLKRLSVTALPATVQSAAREAVFIVKVERRAGFTNGLDLVLEGVPEGISATAEKIPENGAEANIKLVATDKAPVGKEFSLAVLASGLFNDRTYRQKTGPITLAVVAPEESNSRTNQAAK
ncbi:MAG: PPC domain-containing protein [Verrucomicrobiota bacterium]